MTPAFSIVIPELNGRASLEMVFRCLAAQDFPREQFECLVVDDGSTDGTAEFLRHYRAGFDLRPLFHPVNLGRSQARNTACRQAEGDVVVFLDADMLPEPGWLSCYQAAFADGRLDVASGERYHLDLGSKADDHLAALSRLAGAPVADLLCRDIAPQFERLRSRATISMYPTRAMRKFETQLPDACRQHPGSVLAAYAFISSNVAVRRTVLERTSGYDPGLRRVHDTELGIRLWEQGARIGFAPGARAYHMYFSGQGDRDDTLMERMAVFYRHPYRFAILLNLWFAYHEQPEPQFPSPVFESLETLVAADRPGLALDLGAEFQRVYGQPFPAECICEREFMAAYFCELSGIAQADVESYLDRGISRGLIAQVREGRLYFDFYHTTNWLRKCTPYQEYELKHTRYSRLQKSFFPVPAAGRVAARQPSHAGAVRKPLALQCHGVYEVELPLDSFPARAVAGTLNIPLPAEHPCQSGVQLARCTPENLLDYADTARTMIRDFPLQQAVQEMGYLTLRYEFEARLRESLPAASRPMPESPAKLAPFLRPAYPATQLPKAQAVLKKIFLGPVGDAVAAARRIYEWILDNTTYLQGAWPDYAILDTRCGPCIQQARLFVNLCRLMRIPAREQCGLLFGRSLVVNGRQAVRTAGRGHTPLNHTWAEFYAPARGWLPVDFSAGDMGRRILTAVNVIDEALRAEVIAETRKYDEYYFGQLDPFRLYASAQTNKALTCPVVPGLELPVLKRLILDTRQRLTCEFSVVEA
ncbi:MAG: glycosyltransferase [Chloroflexota bacterium]